MKSRKASRKRGTRKEKPIYNSHIHTFTIWNTPILFFLLFVPDSVTGKLSIRRLLVIIIVVSSIVLAFAVAVLLASIVLGKANQLIHTPFSEIIQWTTIYFTQPPALSILPNENPYRAWINTPLLIIRSALSILIVWLVLQQAIRLIVRAIKWLVRVFKAEDRKRQLTSEFLSVRRDIGRLTKPLRKNPILNFLGKLNPVPNDTLERFSRFLSTAFLWSQLNVFNEIRIQYPQGTKFVVLPMNMEHLGKLGWVCRKIDNQHAELLRLARKLNGATEAKRVIYPFFTVHPEQSNIDKVIEKIERGRYFSPDKFRGLKIYPNLGYYPYHEKLRKIYAICEKNGIPVISHCTPHGIWKMGLSETQRKEYGKPEKYRPIMDEFQNLRICLAHFGGAEEWVNRLQKPEDETAWVRIIYDMLRDDKYENLYTDISYTIFEPKVRGLTIDLIDYLKVMLESNTKVKEHVLFGTDYYMIEQEKITEKEVSILLRSRLGDDLFFQIAYKNPRRFLGIR
jgi:predicted TIM-barrel fold metal-dependent hydrolase